MLPIQRLKHSGAKQATMHCQLGLVEKYSSSHEILYPLQQTLCHVCGPQKTNMGSLGHIEVVHMGLHSWVARKKRGILSEKTVPIQSTIALDWVDIFSRFFFVFISGIWSLKLQVERISPPKISHGMLRRNFNGGNEKIHIILSASLFALLITFHNGSPHL